MEMQVEPRVHFTKSQWLYSARLGSDVVAVGGRRGFLRRGVKRYYVTHATARQRQVIELHAADTAAEAIEFARKFVAQSAPKDSS